MAMDELKLVESELLEVKRSLAEPNLGAGRSALSAKYKSLSRKLQQLKSAVRKETKSDCNTSVLSQRNGENNQLEAQLKVLFKTIDRNTLLWINKFSPYCHIVPSQLDSSFIDRTGRWNPSSWIMKLWDTHGYRIVNHSTSPPPDHRNRSALLKDFHLGRLPKLQLTDVANHVVEFAMDRDGTRWLQGKLRDSTEADRQMVFEELGRDAYKVMTDRSATYVAQYLMDIGSEEQKRPFVSEIIEKIDKIMGHPLGRFVLQHFVKVATEPEISMLLLSVKDHLFEMATSKFTSRTLVNCLHRANPEQNRELTQKLINDLQNDPVKIENLSKSEESQYVMKEIFGRADEDLRQLLLSLLPPELTSHWINNQQESQIVNI